MQNQGARKQGFLHSMRIDYPLYLMMIPGLAYFLIFCYLPMYGVTIAFQDYSVYKGFAGSKWVGFMNFRLLFGNILFTRALRNTVLISLYKLVACFPAPILFAIALTEVANKRYKKLVQTVVCLPNFISWVVMYGLIYALISPSSGAIKDVARLFGYEGVIPNLFMKKSSFRGVLVISSLWKGFGYGSIIYIATISGIDPQLYEAAMMDGAGKLQQIWHITLPGMRSVIAIQLIMSMGGIMSAGFDQIFVLYNQAVYDVAEIIDTYVYKVGLNQMKFSASTAAGLFKSLVGLALVLMSNAIAKRIDPDSGLL